MLLIVSILESMHIYQSHFSFHVLNLLHIICFRVTIFRVTILLFCVLLFFVLSIFLVIGQTKHINPVFSLTIDLSWQKKKKKPPPPPPPLPPQWIKSHLSRHSLPPPPSNPHSGPPHLHPQYQVRAPVIPIPHQFF